MIFTTNDKTSNMADKFEKFKRKVLGLDRPLTPKEKKRSEALDVGFQLRMDDYLTPKGSRTIKEKKERKALEDKFYRLGEFLPKAKLKKVKKK